MYNTNVVQFNGISHFNSTKSNQDIVICFLLLHYELHISIGIYIVYECNIEKSNVPILETLPGKSLQ